MSVQVRPEVPYLYAMKECIESKTRFGKFKIVVKHRKEIAGFVISYGLIQMQTAIDEGKESEDKISIKRMLESEPKVKTPVEEAMEIYRLKDFRD